MNGKMRVKPVNHVWTGVRPEAPRVQCLRRCTHSPACANAGGCPYILHIRRDPGLVLLVRTGWLSPGSLGMLP